MRIQYACPCCTYSVPRREQTCPVCGALMQALQAGTQKKPAGRGDPFAAVPFVP